MRPRKCTWLKSSRAPWKAECSSSGAIWAIAKSALGMSVAARDKKLPVPEYSDWFTLNGLIDSFRMWARELSAAYVRTLATRDGADEKVRDQPMYSLKRDFERNRMGYPTRVKCTRPRERTLVLV